MLSNGQVVITCNDQSWEPNIYTKAPVFVTSRVAPGIGLHNPGVEGGFLYYQGGRLKLIDSTGKTYIIDMTATGSL